MTAKAVKETSLLLLSSRLHSWRLDLFTAFLIFFNYKNIHFFPTWQRLQKAQNKKRIKKITLNAGGSIPINAVIFQGRKKISSLYFQQILETQVKEASKCWSRTCACWKQSPAAPEQYTAMLDVNLNTQEGERYGKFIRSLLHDCCKLQEAEYHWCKTQRLQTAGPRLKMKK